MASVDRPSPAPESEKITALDTESFVAWAKGAEALIVDGVGPTAADHFGQVEALASRKYVIRMETDPNNASFRQAGVEHFRQAKGLAEMALGQPNQAAEDYLKAQLVELNEDLDAFEKLGHAPDRFGFDTSRRLESLARLRKPRTSPVEDERERIRPRERVSRYDRPRERSRDERTR